MSTELSGGPRAEVFESRMRPGRTQTPDRAAALQIPAAFVTHWVTTNEPRAILRALGYSPAQRDQCTEEGNPSIAAKVFVASARIQSFGCLSSSWTCDLAAFGFSFPSAMTACPTT